MMSSGDEKYEFRYVCIPCIGRELYEGSRIRFCTGTLNCGQRKTCPYVYLYNPPVPRKSARKRAEMEAKEEPDSKKKCC